MPSEFLAVLVFVLVVSCIGLVGLIFALFDRIVVGMIRLLHLPVCSPAIGIAILIGQRPELWSVDKYRMHHPDIGSIWIANDAYGLRIETVMGTWTPNLIERRIIRDAVDWRITRFVRERVMAAVQRNILSN